MCRDGPADKRQGVHGRAAPGILRRMGLKICTHALVRPPGASFAAGISAGAFGRADLDLAREQHGAYTRALAAAGVEVITLPPLDDFPDSCFVEDCAIVIGDGFVATRPGAEARRGEVASIEAALTAHLAKLGAIVGAGTVDGGDVLRAGEQYFIGASERSNADGAAQLIDAIEFAGARGKRLDFSGALHLKSLCSPIGDNVVLAVPALIEPFRQHWIDVVEVGDLDAYGANALRVNDTLMIAAGFGAVRRAIVAAGVVTDDRIVELDMSEFRKQDGALTCLCLLW